MALSTPISLTTVRDFFGSSSNNLTALHRGENNVINVTNTYNTSTTGLGNLLVSANGSIRTASASDYLLVNSSVQPFNYYEYGGTCPSISSANTAIQDTGPIELTDYVGAYRKVTPTVAYVGNPPATAQGSHTGNQRGVSSPITNPMSYKSWVGINYETLNSNPGIGGPSIPKYCQLLTMQSEQFGCF